MNSQPDPGLKVVEYFCHCCGRSVEARMVRLRRGWLVSQCGFFDRPVIRRVTPVNEYLKLSRIVQRYESRKERRERADRTIPSVS
jgi:hypothetical protein